MPLRINLVLDSSVHIRKTEQLHQAKQLRVVKWSRVSNEASNGIFNITGKTK